MTRDETVALLRLRWRLTDQRFDDETADGWHELLCEHTSTTATRALQALVRDGATKVTLGDLFRHLPVTARAAPAADDGCHHDEVNQWRLCLACGTHIPSFEQGMAIVRAELAKAEKTYLADRYTTALQAETGPTIVTGWRARPQENP